MNNNQKAVYRHEIFSKKVMALIEKIAIAFEGEEIHVCMSSLMGMLTLVSQELSPESRYQMAECLEDCIKELKESRQTHTIH